MKRTKRGYTLVEVILCMIVLSILAAIALPRFVDLTGAADSARVNANSDTLTLRYATYVSQNSALGGSTVYPDLTTLVGASAPTYPAVPVGWTNNATPPASTSYVYNTSGSSTYYTPDKLNITWTDGTVSGSVGFLVTAAQANNTYLQPYFQSWCDSVFGALTNDASGTTSIPWKIVCGRNYGYGGTLLTTSGYFFAHNNPTISQSLAWDCPSGGTVTAANTCTLTGTYSCPAGYTASGVGTATTCALSNASLVTCPTGYTRSGANCNRTVNTVTPGFLPFALDYSGICVGPGQKSRTWINTARTVATTATTSSVFQVDITPVTDLVNCPSSLF